MDQKKIGTYLKQLRRSKGLTQEQLAEQFLVSSRSVSRWETGRNLPDVDVLLELADFYKVDVRDILEGGFRNQEGRKNAMVTVAEYATRKERRVHSGLVYTALGTAVALLICTFLFADRRGGLLYGVIPEEICDGIRILVSGTALCLLVSCLRVRLWQEKPAREPRKTVAATVVSKAVKPGTYGAGRSQTGYAFTVTFQTEDAQTLELFSHELEFGGLKVGMTGALTYKGRYFIDFQP